MESKIYYFHGECYDKHFNQIRFTIAGKFIENYTKLQIAFAVCSIKDQFSKKRGRELAKERLELADFFFSMKNVKTINIEDVLKAKAFNQYKPFIQILKDNPNIYEGFIFNTFSYSLNYKKENDFYKL